MTPVSRPARRLVLAAGLLTAVLISCGREVTGPVSTPVNAFKRFASLAFEPQYATSLSSSALRAALTQVAFERVRITLRREDGTIALDTVVNFPAGSDSLTLSLVVQLAANAPATGVPFSLNLGYVNAAGDTVFKGGPFPVTVTPSAGGSAPPPPVQIPVHYTGTGASATSVAISPKVVNGSAGQSASFSAQALGSGGQVIAGTPIVFTSSDAGVITVNSISGAASLVGRGTAKVYAQLLTGPSDSATVSVILPASRIEISSGSAQTAPAGSTLPQPVVARVLAADGIGVGGVTVNFAVTAGGGSVTPTSAVSAADGSVSTSWKLGGTAGAQTISVSSAGLTGSPLSVSATALPVVASRLLITTGPVGGKAGAPIGAVVAAQDALGNTVTTFTGDVSVAIGVNPGSGTLSGTTTVKAVNGVATFSGLSLNRPGTGYTLTFSSAGLAGATSTAFSILPGDAAKLVFGAMPAAADVGISIAPPVIVSAQDSAGNTVTTFTGAVTVAIGTNTGGGTLTGTLSRNAVAGIATFSDLVINRKGSSYTLVASATGLVSATSAAFNMAAGAPTGISVVSGGGQTALAGAALGAIVLQLHDALGNGIAGATITLAVTTGGGSLGAASLVTDTDGKVTVAWTLGNTGGTQTITASSVGVPNVIVGATASVPVTTAKTLVISTQPQASQIAGTSGTNIVVQAKDSAGALASTFSGNVTMSIASGPLVATILGTATKAAVAGVATFSGVSFDKAGAYTVTFSSAGLASATSTSFTVNAGAAKNITADSGQGQAGSAGQPLPLSPVVRVTDQYGNPVTGTSLTWTVATGGGSIDSATTLTNSAGRARMKWTLGATIGAQTLNVVGAGLLPNPLTFNATASGVAYSKLWTGAVDTLWTTAGNWSPSGAPSATDSVRIDSVTNMLTVYGGQTIAKLIVSPGARVNLNGNYLQVNGSVNVGGGTSFTGNGVFVLNGTGTVVGPALPYTNVQGSYSLTGATNFSSSVEVKSGGTLNTNSFNSRIAGTFSTSGSGVLQMASGTVTVGGNAFFAGGSESGLLTGGTLRVRGNFTQASSGTGAGEAFRASGTHQVAFDSISAAGLIHTISFAAPDTALTATCTAGRSCFNSINFAHIAGPSAGVKFSSSAKALGPVDLAGAGLDSLVMPTSSLLTIAGNFSTGCCTPRRFNRVALGGTTNNGGVSGVAVDTMIFFGTGQSAAPLGILIGTNSVRISGTATMTSGNIPGNVMVDGATAVLDIGTTAGYLQVSGNLTTQNGGKLKMTDAADSLDIGGSVTFAGGSTAGLLTAGFMRVHGNFTTGGAGADPQSFAANALHAVSFEGSGVRRLRMLNGGVSASHFAELYHGFSDTLYLKTDVYAGSFETGIVSIHPLRADTSFSPMLVTKGADLRNVVFDGVRFGLAEGNPVTDLDNVVFVNQDPAATQLTIKRSGTGTAGSITALSGTWTFSTTPTSGLYLDAQDIDGASPDILAVNFSGSVQPATNGGKASLSNGATTNWPVGMTYVLGVSGLNWSDPSAWSPNGVPGANDDVTIGGEKTVALSGNAAVHSLSFSTGIVNLGNFDLAVSGNVTGNYGYVNSSGTGALHITGAGAHSLTLQQAPTLAIDAGAMVTMGANTNASGDVNISGMLAPNGHNLTVTGTLSVLSGGGLKMTQALDSVFTWDASFAGVASDTLLTNGYLAISDNFTQSGGTKSFAPTGAHVTSLWAESANYSLRASRTISAGIGDAPAGTPSPLGVRSRRRASVTETAVPGGRRRFLTYNQIAFANPGYSASHFNILELDPVNSIVLGTDVYATRTQVVGTPNAYIYGPYGTPVRLVQQGAALTHLTFSGVQVQVDAGGALDKFNHISFTSQDSTVDQLTLSRNGGAVTLDSVFFNNIPGPAGHFVKLVDGPSPFTVTFTHVEPGAHGGHVSLPGGSSFTNWVASRNMTATASGTWNTPGTWSPIGTPSMFDTVTIATGASVQLDGGGMVRDMVIAAGATFDMPSYTSLDVYGNWNSDTASAVTGGSGSYTNFYGNAQVRGKLWGASVGKGMTLIGRTIFDGNVSVGDYAYTPITFDVNGQVANINGGFSTWYGGRLKMSSPAGDLRVCCSLSFTGGTTDGLLTDGILRITGSFTAAGAAFSATGNHTTIVSSPGGFGNSISFDAPGTTSLTGHFGILQLSDTVHSTTLSSDVYAVTKLTTLGTFTPVTLVGSATVLHAPTAASTKPLVLNRVRLHLWNADASSSLQNATFSNFQSITGEDQLTIENNSASPVTVNGISNLTFSTLSINTWNYVVANQLGVGTLTVNLTSMSPSAATSAGKRATTGGAILTWTP